MDKFDADKMTQEKADAFFMAIAKKFDGIASYDVSVKTASGATMRIIELKPGREQAVEQWRFLSVAGDIRRTLPISIVCCPPRSER